MGSANSGREILDDGANAFNLIFRQGEFGAEDGGFYGGECSFALDQSIPQSLLIVEEIEGFSEVNQK
jgi:hypothetical protein